MNASFLRPARRLLAPLLATAAAAASAHTYLVPLGEPAGATHYVGIICSTDAGVETDHLFVQLTGHTPNAPLVSAQVIKGSLATNTTDTVNGDDVPSPASRTRGGNGLYQVLLNKSGPGAVVFTISLHCMDASGTLHTGTDGVIYQFQDR